MDCIWTELLVRGGQHTPKAQFVVVSNWTYAVVGHASVPKEFTISNNEKFGNVYEGLATVALLRKDVVFLRNLARHPVYPLRDPRLKEALTIHGVPPPAIAESVGDH